MRRRNLYLLVGLAAGFSACAVWTLGDGDVELPPLSRTVTASPTAPTMVLGEPVVFRTTDRGERGYSVVFRLNRDPLSRRPGPENRNRDRGAYGMAGYDLTESAGVRKFRDRRLCFIAWFDPPLDEVLRERLERIGVGGRVEVWMRPRASGGREFRFRPRIRKADETELNGEDDRKVLARVGC